MENKPYLFEWDRFTTPDMPHRLSPNPVRYTLVYATNAVEAHKKLNESMNKTQISWNIRLATVVPEDELSAYHSYLNPVT